MPGAAAHGPAAPENRGGRSSARPQPRSRPRAASKGVTRAGASPLPAGTHPALTGAGSAAAPSPWRSVGEPLRPSLLHGTARPPLPPAAGCQRGAPAPAPAARARLPGRGGGGAMAASPGSPGALRRAGNEEFRRGQYGPAAELYSRALAQLEAAGRVGHGPGRASGRASGGTLLNRVCPAQGMPAPRRAACCWPTAPPATSRTVPAASAWPTVPGE